MLTAGDQKVLALIGSALEARARMAEDDEIETATDYVFPIDPVGWITTLSLRSGGVAPISDNRLRVSLRRLERCGLVKMRPAVPPRAVLKGLREDPTFAELFDKFIGPLDRRTKSIYITQAGVALFSSLKRGFGASEFFSKGALLPSSITSLPKSSTYVDGEVSHAT